MLSVRLSWVILLCLTFILRAGRESKLTTHPNDSALLTQGLIYPSHWTIGHGKRYFVGQHAAWKHIVENVRFPSLFGRFQLAFSHCMGFRFQFEGYTKSCVQVGFHQILGFSGGVGALEVCKWIYRCNKRSCPNSWVCKFKIAKVVCRIKMFK